MCLSLNITANVQLAVFFVHACLKLITPFINSTVDHRRRSSESPQVRTLTIIWLWGSSMAWTLTIIWLTWRNAVFLLFQTVHLECHQQRSFTLKMHQNRWRLRLRPRPHWWLTPLLSTMLCNERQSNAAWGRPRLELVSDTYYPASRPIFNSQLDEDSGYSEAINTEEWTSKFHDAVAWSSDAHAVPAHCLTERCKHWINVPQCSTSNM